MKIISKLRNNGVLINSNYTKNMLHMKETLKKEIMLLILKCLKSRQSKIADQDPQDPQDPHYEYINYFPPYIHKSFMRIIILCTLLECIRNE